MDGRLIKFDVVVSDRPGGITSYIFVVQLKWNDLFKEWPN